MPHGKVHRADGISQSTPIKSMPSNGINPSTSVSGSYSRILICIPDFQSTPVARLPGWSFPPLQAKNLDSCNSFANFALIRSGNVLRFFFPVFFFAACCVEFCNFASRPQWPKGRGRHQTGRGRIQNCICPNVSHIGGQRHLEYSEVWKLNGQKRNPLLRCL